MLIEIGSGPAARRLDLFSMLDPDDEERAHEEAYAWIKAVRSLRVDGASFRTRFTLRGDSLWWFAELYLHKEQAIHAAVRIVRAVERLVERESPRVVRLIAGRHGQVLASATAARGLACEAVPTGRDGSLIALDGRAVRLAAMARLSRLRVREASGPPARVAAFVHSAFWRRDVRDGGAESYIGPILRSIEARAGTDAVRYVGVGPRTNFRARRWWDPLTGDTPDNVVPIERFAPWAAMRGSREVQRRRHEFRRAMAASAELRDHAVIRGTDCWPLVERQLAGIALLQFPWSARAMDEAAAALAALRPEVAVTYAEAGGWGRALALEARRAGVPLAGLQHGFIYRHWLNYRHEPDEMLPDPANAADRGFPLPARTLLFDEHAAAHLQRAGRFPREALAVTGSARLDELVDAVRALPPEECERAAREAGAGATQSLIVFAAKEREAGAALPALIAAVGGMPEVHLAIKPHPAETAEVYDEAVKGVANVRVLSPRTPLPPLLAAARGLVTVNSTVAIDALALALPSLVIGLPNNLSPFVDAGVMLGGGTAEEIRQGLRRLLYDQEFHRRIESRRSASAGNAAAASADAILSLRHVRS
jgi:hypothetical protein